MFAVKMNLYKIVVVAVLFCTLSEAVDQGNGPLISALQPSTGLDLPEMSAISSHLAEQRQKRHVGDILGGVGDLVGGILGGVSDVVHPGPRYHHIVYLPERGPGYGPEYEPNYWPGYRPGYGPGYGPGYSRGYGPGYGPDYGPGYGPGYSPGPGFDYRSGAGPGPGSNGPGYGPNYGPGNSPGPVLDYRFGSNPDSGFNKSGYKYENGAYVMTDQSQYEGSGNDQLQYRSQNM